MKINKRTNFGIAAATLGLTLLSVACGDVGGEGNLRLLDQSENHDKSIRPLAAGRTVEYQVSRSSIIGQAITLTNAVSTNTSVFAVDNFSGNKVIVNALAQGSADLSLEAGEIADRFQLEVRDENGAFFRVNEGSTYYTRVREHAGIRVPLSSTLRLTHQNFLDSNGRGLSGKGGSIAWTAVTGENVTITPQDDGYTLSVVTASEDGTGSITSPWTSTPFRVVSSGEFEASTMTAYTAMTAGGAKIEGKTITFENNSLGVVVVDVLDTNGFAHVGDWDMNGRVTLSDNGVGRITVDTAGCEEAIEDKGCKVFTDVDIFRMLVAGGSDGGSVSVKVEVDGLSEDWTFKFEN